MRTWGNRGFRQRGEQAEVLGALKEPKPEQRESEEMGRDAGGLP